MRNWLRCVSTGVALAVGLLLACTLGACEPPRNHALAANGATVTGLRNASGSHGRPECAIDGDVVAYGYSHGYGWAYVQTPTVVTFAHSAMIDTIEVVFSDISLRTYSYILSVSLDGEGWQTVADMSDAHVSGWRLHQFEPVEAKYVRLDCTDTSLSIKSYHIVEIGAFLLGEKRAAGPLGLAWQEAARKQRVVSRELLGVDAAQGALDDSGFLEKLRSGPADTSEVRELSNGTRALFYRDGEKIIAAIDDDGNMDMDALEPDGINDCVAVDMNGDGRLDRTIDYSDTSGDGIADTMVQTYGDRNTWGSRPFMVLIRDFDTGPLRLWSLYNYGYSQGVCQWDCDFGGNGYFAMFRRNLSGSGWQGAFECPFCFYDTDDDGLAEETVRLTAYDTTLHSSRYGINADNDITEGHLYDYDMSVTCLGRVPIPDEAMATFRHRSGEETGAYLSYEKTRETVRAADWDRALLVWDENDHNVAPRAAGMERWEGVLNSRYRSFPQEGGPDCGTINKRYELDADYSGKMRLYYWPADGRLHLYGAEEGTLIADWDYDGCPDLVVEYTDRDGDGFFDHRSIDYSAKALPDRAINGPREYRLPDGLHSVPAHDAILACDYAAVAPVWAKALPRRIADGEALLQALMGFAERQGLEVGSLPLDFYRKATPDEFEYIERHRASREALRYYQDLTLEVLLARLSADAGCAVGDEASRLSQARRLYDRGLLQRAAEMLEKVRQP